MTRGSDDPVAALRAAGQHLVDALRDQVADGQVETLASLQTATASLRRQAAGTAEAVSGMTEAVLADVARGLEALLQETLATLGERVAAETDETTQSLTRSAEKVARHLGGAEKSLQALADRAVERADQARAALEAATAAFAAQAASTQDVVERAADTMQERFRATAAEAEERIATATDAAVHALRVVAAETEQQLADTRARADAALDEHLSALQGQLAAQLRRDSTVSTRLQKQVEALVERTDATAGRTVAQLEQLLGDLRERDRALEQDRAEAFVRVLDQVLPSGSRGRGGRRLRGAVRDGLATGRDSTHQVDGDDA